MWNKTLSLVLVFVVACPLPLLAEPVIADIPLPPASFTHVTDLDLLSRLGLDGYDDAWCYDTHANSILITAPARERAKCELKTKYELERQRVTFQFKIDKLNLRIETLTKQYEDINRIKDIEIERLTAAVINRPADNNFWWATGGVLAGSAVTILIGWAIFSVQSGD